MRDLVLPNKILAAIKQMNYCDLLIFSHIIYTVYINVLQKNYFFLRMINEKMKELLHCRVSDRDWKK
jgi:hypothetical protein